MKKYIAVILLILGLNAKVYPLHQTEFNEAPDSLYVGYGTSVLKRASAYSSQSIHASTLDNSPHVDVAKALYGKIAGLNVYQGSGPSSDNLSVLSFHGQAPLVLVDGYPRDLADIVVTEIESISILKDAAAAALYGVRGANGIVMINTKRGKDQKLKITAEYTSGFHAQFRSPIFADSYTYASSLNSALSLDGLSKRYDENELNAFRDNRFPFAYPNVNWWKESFNDLAYNHRLKLTFNGGNDRFRYFSAVDYMHDRGFFKANATDDRFSSKLTDVRLTLRTNIDVNVTPTTYFKLGVIGKLMETNRARYGSIYRAIYNTPSAVFPVKYENGVFGGNAIYTSNNPVALLTETGAYKTTYGTLLADARLTQRLDGLLDGLSAEVAVAFDNIGSMYDTSSKQYRYMDAQPSILNDGITLVTTPLIYGRDSEVLSHGQGFTALTLRSSLQGIVKYQNSFNDINDLSANLIYDQQAYIRHGRNESTKRQSFIGAASYTYDNRYNVNGVLNYSGSAYLPKESRYQFYPAISAGWILSEEEFMKSQRLVDYFKLYASYGASGWDGNLTHELYRQGYGNTYGSGYFFTNNVGWYGGQGEGPLPVENLVPEKTLSLTYGVDMALLEKQLLVSLEGFHKTRSNILVPANTVSEIIGIDVLQQNAGIQEYRGFDLSVQWEQSINKFNYQLYANGAYIDSKIVNDNQEYQEYEYLYRKGNRVGQFYGLEVEGFFQDQMQINNSPVQTFSTVRPGDIRYKDQNGDGLINEQDMVRMFGSSVPRFYFGFGLNASYRNVELSMDFQGLTGKTVNLLNSTLYQPLVDNGNISKTFLDNETPWSPENASTATMPRLTTLSNANNYRVNSLWLRDGSFIKLRDLTVAYTIPKEITTIADMKVYVRGTNLFSADNIKTLDPEQLSSGYPTSKSYWIGLKLNF